MRPRWSSGRIHSFDSAVPSSTGVNMFFHRMLDQMMDSLSHRRPVFESLADIYFLGDEREAAMGRVGAQRPVLHVN